MRDQLRLLYLLLWIFNATFIICKIAMHEPVHGCVALLPMIDCMVRYIYDFYREDKR